MTEDEWGACRDPEPMLGFLRGRVGDRQLRLFACACCRRVWGLFAGVIGPRLVEQAEALADGLTDARPGLADKLLAVKEARNSSDSMYAAGAALQAAVWASEKDAFAAAANASSWALEAIAVKARNWDSAADELAVQARMLRCLVGPRVFGAPRLDPLPPGGEAVALARFIADTQRYDRLPDLAAALERAGRGTSPAVRHCRQPGPHVRGCWAVDLVLGTALRG